MKSPLNWIGGKARSAARIIARMPEHTCYVEPFVGAGSVFFNKPRAKAEVLNDMDEELLAFYRVVQGTAKALRRRVIGMPHSRALYARLQRARPKRLMDRAARFWFLQKFAFGGKVRGQSFGYSRTDACRQHPDLILQGFAAAAERLHRVTLECGSWQSVVRRYDAAATLFYCDPPYWRLPYYRHNFQDGDHAELAQALRGIKGRFLLSYNDVPAIRALYRWAQIEVLPVAYAIRPQRAAAGRGELLITNFEPVNPAEDRMVA